MSQCLMTQTPRWESVIKIDHTRSGLHTNLLCLIATVQSLFYTNGSLLTLINDYPSPFHLPNDKTRAFRIHLTPTYSIQDRFISSLAAKFQTKEILTVQIINNMCRKEGVRDNDIVELLCTQRSTVLRWRTLNFRKCCLLLRCFLLYCSFTASKLIAIQISQSRQAAAEINSF